MNETLHQYIERESGAVRTESLLGDRWIRMLYGPAREAFPVMFRAMVSTRWTRHVGALRYDRALSTAPATRRRQLKECGVVDDECLTHPTEYRTLREVFERQITYWSHRPLPEESRAVVSPADSRVIIGSFRSIDGILVKEKVFDLPGLLGDDRPPWKHRFAEGDFAVFRLTPDKYHYTHTPVTGVVADHYDVEGVCHSCNPGALVRVSGTYARNRRTVTVFNTDVPGGSGVGHVAMVEVVALMIGRIDQGYCATQYQDPVFPDPGLDVERGQPKALFRPGSSTVILLFEPDRIRFAEDLILHSQRRDVQSRFRAGFTSPLVETDVRVRAPIASPAEIRI